MKLAAIEEEEEVYLGKATLKYKLKIGQRSRSHQNNPEKLRLESELKMEHSNQYTSHKYRIPQAFLVVDSSMKLKW